MIGFTAKHALFCSTLINAISIVRAYLSSSMHRFSIFSWNSNSTRLNAGHPFITAVLVRLPTLYTEDDSTLHGRHVRASTNFCRKENTDKSRRFTYDCKVKTLKSTVTVQKHSRGLFEPATLLWWPVLGAQAEMMWKFPRFPCDHSVPACLLCGRPEKSINDTELPLQRKKIKCDFNERQQKSLPDNTCKNARRSDGNISVKRNLRAGDWNQPTVDWKWLWKHLKILPWTSFPTLSSSSLAAVTIAPPCFVKIWLSTKLRSGLAESDTQKVNIMLLCW